MPTMQEVKDNFVSVITQVSEETQHHSFKMGDMEFASGASDDLSAVKFDGNDLLLTGGAFRQLSTELGIPVPYASKIPGGFRDTTFNYFLQANKNSEYTALVNEGHVRSFLDSEKPYIPTADIFNTVVNVFDGDYDIRYPHLSDVKTSVSILPLQYKEAIDGSDIYAGLKLVYSDSWAHPLSIDTYVWRELCSNGMISELESRKMRVTGKSISDILQQVNEFTQLSLQKIPELIDNYKALVNEAVTDYVRVIKGICISHKLSTKVKDRILLYAGLDEYLDTITDQKITNMSDIVNLFTYVGTHDDTLSPEVREILMSIGGQLTLEHDERCNSCGSHI